MKILLNIIGCIAVVLAVLGVFLPLLPTTPFLLLASACFVRGSTRLHGWLLNNRMFGVYLRNYEAGMGIPRRAKITVIALLWISLGYSIFRFDSLLLQAMLLTIGICVTTYLLKFVPTMRSAGPGR